MVPLVTDNKFLDSNIFRMIKPLKNNCTEDLFDNNLSFQQSATFIKLPFGPTKYVPLCNAEASVFVNSCNYQTQAEISQTVSKMGIKHNVCTFIIIIICLQTISLL